MHLSRLADKLCFFSLDCKLFDSGCCTVGRRKDAPRLSHCSAWILSSFPTQVLTAVSLVKQGEPQGCEPLLERRYQTFSYRLHPSGHSSDKDKQCLSILLLIRRELASGQPE